MFIIDAHLDLSMNALEWNRDLRQPVKEIRSREAGLTDKPDRGKGTVSLPALRRGKRLVHRQQLLCARIRGRERKA